MARHPIYVYGVGHPLAPPKLGAGLRMLARLAGRGRAATYEGLRNAVSARQRLRGNGRGSLTLGRVLLTL